MYREFIQTSRTNYLIKKMTDLNKIQGFIYGYAIGDAIGVPYEFMPSESVKNAIENNGLLTSGGYHSQPIGTWSDDTSLTMATVESLIYGNGVNLSDMSKRFINWYDVNYWSCGDVFDCGRTTSRSISELKDLFLNTIVLQGLLTEEDFVNCGANGLMDNGNGSLMRILPLAFLQFNNDREFIQTVTTVSSLTHAHKMSTTSCVALCYFFKDLFKTDDYLRSWVNTANFLDSQDLIDNLKDLKIIDNLDGFLKSDYPSKNPNTGFVVTTLQAVLWSLMNGRNYEETVRLAISCGEDTDTVAAIAGGIAGYKYGFENIPLEWVNVLRYSNRFKVLTEKFYNFLTKNQ